MSTIGIQRVTAVIEFVIDYQPAVVTLLTPFPDVDMLLGRREQAVVLLHQSLHAGTHSRGIYYSLHTLGAHIQYVERERRHLSIDDYHPVQGRLHQILQGSTPVFVTFLA